MYLLGGLQPGQLQHGRHDVDQRDQLVALDALRLVKRGGDDQRYPDGGLVQQQPVLALPVLTESLAVIGCHHDVGLVGLAGVVQPRGQPADQGVGPGDLTDVGPVGVSRPEGLGRLVRGVRIVQVHPHEERGRVVLAGPRQGGVDDLRSGTLHAAQKDRSLLGHLELVEVPVEPLGQAPARVEDKGSDEAAGPVAGLPEALGQGLQLFRRDVHAVVAHPVVGRVGSGEQRRVRGQRQRRRGVGAHEGDPAGGKRIDNRCVDLVEAVHAETIGARRVERQQQDVELAVAAELLEARPRGRSRATADRQQDDRPHGRDSGERCQHPTTSRRTPTALEARHPTRLLRHGARGSTARCGPPSVGRPRRALRESSQI